MSRLLILLGYLCGTFGALAAGNGLAVVSLVQYLGDGCVNIGCTADNEQLQLL